MRKLSALLYVCSFLTLAGTLHAQQIDAQFGLSGFHSQSVNNFDITDLNHSPQSLSGGIFPSVGADVILWRNLGVDGEVSWKGSRALYQSTLDYRPILWDFNAVYARREGRIGFAGMAGVGGESVRFYGIQSCNSFQCTNFVSTNHLLGHLGAALRLYATHSVYVAPEIHYYFVRNNLEFTSAGAARYGINIGYTFGK